jgi:mono/diheme cytochrome c family protein
MKKQVHPAIELSLVVALIIAAVIFVWNVDFSFGSKEKSTTSKPTPTVATQTPSSANEQWLQGKNLFKSNCAACHNPKADGTGPVLIGAMARWEKAGNFKGKTGKQWLYAWIRNWNEPVEAGYPYAKEMSYMRASVMNVFPQLSDADIDALLVYTEQPDLYKSNR